MAYEFLPELARADIAFRARGKSLEEVFISASEAMLNVMIENPEALKMAESRTITLKNQQLDLLLFDALQELIYYKDAEQLLLRFTQMQIEHTLADYALTALAEGEILDVKKHEQRADVKAVTLSNLRVESTESGFQATVVLDI